MPNPPTIDDPPFQDHRPADAAFLGLEHRGEGRFEFVVEERLARLDGRLYGGTAIAVSVAASEQVTDRSALWMTTQFVATTDQQARLEVTAEILAPGRRTQQVRVTGTDADGRVIFASLGATGRHLDDGLTGTFERCPTVAPPEESTRWDSPFAAMAEAAGVDPQRLGIPPETGFTKSIELRHAPVTEHPDPGPGRVCVWARRSDGSPITPALAAFLADLDPMSVARACEVLAFGTSLDNTIRVGPFVDSEWILLDLRPHLAFGGYAHGVVHVWSLDGTLMVTASQTASMRAFELAESPWAASAGTA